MKMENKNTATKYWLRKYFDCMAKAYFKGKITKYEYDEFLNWWFAEENL